MRCMFTSSDGRRFSKRAICYRKNSDINLWKTQIIMDFRKRTFDDIFADIHTMRFSTIWWTQVFFTYCFYRVTRNEEVLCYACKEKSVKGQALMQFLRGNWLNMQRAFFSNILFSSVRVAIKGAKLHCATLCIDHRFTQAQAHELNMYNLDASNKM